MTSLVQAGTFSELPAVGGDHEAFVVTRPTALAGIYTFENGVWALRSGSGVTSVYPGIINLHASKYAVPTDGVTPCGAKILLAMADVPSWGALQFGTYPYNITDLGANGIDLSNRLDITLLGAGGGPWANDVSLPSTRLVQSGANRCITIAPGTLQQHGPQIYNINAYDGAAGTATAFYVANVNQTLWFRCGGKYLNKVFHFDAGSDNAWHDVYSPTCFQANVGFHFNNNFGVRVFGGQIFVGSNSQQGVLGSNQAQSNKFFGTFFDGTTGGNIGNGDGIQVDATGAHDWDLYGVKMEALLHCLNLFNTGAGPPTRGIKAFGGSFSAFAGTEQMVMLRAGVDRTLIDNVAFPANNTYASMVNMGVGDTNTVWNWPDDKAIFADTFAAAYAPTSMHLGCTKTVAMTAAITSVAAIPDGYNGCPNVVMIFTQGGAGSFALPAAASWTGYAMQAVSNVGNTVGKRTVFEFKYVSGTWVQVGGPNVWF